MNEKRQSVRVRALKGARIVFNHGSSALDCTVRNVSEGGAKLIVENAFGIPDQFELVFDDGARRTCAVRWRKLQEIGVSYGES